MARKFYHIICTALVGISLTSCQTAFKATSADGLTLPFIKNNPNECYYLDEFMPVPNHLVTGKSGPLSLRYYTYNAANYKDWNESQIILSFYSKDDQCWSLFEEYYLIE